MALFVEQNRMELGLSIGKNLGIVIDGTATSTVDTSSLIDTKNLLGADDDHNRKEVTIYDAAGSIVDGESSIVDDYAGSTHDATMSPVFSASIASGDKYEMWTRPWNRSVINNAISQAIHYAASIGALVDRQVDSQWTQADLLEYDWLTPYTFPNDFKWLTRVEYVSEVGVEHLLSDCETVWTAGTSVTATADSAFKKVGTYSAKFVVATGAASGATLCYKDISSVDLSDCDKIEKWFYSSIALTAGQLQFMAGATAAIASPLETISLPAIAAATWTRISISLANPHLDTAIISIGIRQASGVDVGAFTFYMDDIDAVLANSKVYKTLSDEYWDTVKGSTPLLKLTTAGLNLVGDNTQIRLTGFSPPDDLTDNTTDSEVSPAWIVNRVSGMLAPSVKDKAHMAQLWLGEAKMMERGLAISIPGGARKV